MLSLWFLVFQDYQKARLLDFLSFKQPETNLGVVAEESSGAYNARQALIAVGSGQIWGRGLGQGVQSHLRFLPERQTDFIFASFAEEWGFVGTIFLLLLYLILLSFLLYIAYKIKDFSERLYLIALFVMFLVKKVTLLLDYY